MFTCNRNTKNIMKICATCLSQSKFEFPLSEDIKGILRSLLYDFDIDAFLQSLPPDKQLKLCNTCNYAIHDMIVFKERAQKCFREIMKYWCDSMSKQTTGNTVSVPSSSQISNVTPSHTVEIEAPNEIKHEVEEPDPLEIDKTGTETITSSNIYDSFIDIKEETNPDSFNSKPIVNNSLDVAANRYDKFSCNYVTNKVSTQTNENFNSTVAPVVLSSATSTTPSRNIVNKATAMTMSSNDICNHYINEINEPVGSSPKFLRNIVPVVNHMAPTHINEKSYENFVNDQVAAASNEKSKQKFKNNNFTVPLTKGTSQTFVPMRVTSGEASAKKIRNFNRNLILQNPPTAIPTTSIRIAPKPKISIAQKVTDDSGATSADDSVCQGEFLSPNSEDRIKKGGEKCEEAVQIKKSLERNPNRGQTKWYINIVSREDVIKSMEERRNHPEFLKAPYKCVSCVSLFPNQWVVETHKKTIHCEEYEFTCFACQCTFKYLNSLNSHYDVHMFDKYVYRCITCEFKTRDVEYIKSHVCPNAGSEPLLPKDPNSMRVSVSRSLYYCPKCEFISIRAAAVVTHYTNNHKNNPKLQCKECGKCYKNETDLWFHVETVHRGKKKMDAPVPVYCNLCDMWYWSQHYDTHVKQKHTPRDSKFECNECGKKLLSAKQLENHKESHAIMKTGVATMMLRRHSARHSDARPYKCSFCGDTFKYTAALHTHTKLKHKKNKSAEGLPNKKKTRETPKKDKGQKKRRKEKRKKVVKRKRVVNSSTEKELTGVCGRQLNF